MEKHYKHIYIGVHRQQQRYFWIDVSLNKYGVGLSIAIPKIGMMEFVTMRMFKSPVFFNRIALGWKFAQLLIAYNGSEKRGWQWRYSQTFAQMLIEDQD